MLLVASIAMLMQSACSNSPPPATSTESGKVITKIHTRDGTLYVTSRYAVTDSFVVIEELLRDRKYYPDEAPHLYNHPEAVKAPPANLDFPVMLPLRQVDRIEPWKDSHKTSNGVLAGFGIGLLIFVGVLILLDSQTSSWGGGD